MNVCRILIVTNMEKKEIICPICGNKMEICSANQPEPINTDFHYHKCHLYRIDTYMQTEITYRCNECLSELKTFNTYKEEKNIL